MANLLTPVRADTYQHLQLNAGVFLVGFDYDSYTDAAGLRTAVKAAITAGTSILGATRGGGSFRVTPETRKIEADGVRYGFVGDTVVDSVDVSMTGTLLEVNPDNFKRILATGDASTSGNVTTLTMRTDIASSDYISSLVWVGDMSDGSLLLISMDNALNTNGLDFSFSDKSETTMAFEFHAHQSDVSTNDKAPFEVVFFKKAAAQSGT